MPHTSFEQFLSVLLDDVARRRVGLNLDDAEAARIASNPKIAHAYYDNWVNPPPPPAAPPAGWYPAPHAGGIAQYWDGVKWLASAPPSSRAPATPPASCDSSQSFMEAHPALVVACAAAFFSLLAILPWPYEYYVFLRWALSITAVFIGVHAIRSEQQMWLFAAIPIFVLWAPAAFFTLDRAVWSVLNVTAAVVLVAAGWFLSGPMTARPDGKRRWEWWKIAALTFGIGLALAFLGQPAIGAVDCDIAFERSGTACY